MWLLPPASGCVLVVWKGFAAVVPVDWAADGSPCLTDTVVSSPAKSFPQLRRVIGLPRHACVGALFAAQKSEGEGEWIHSC